MNASLILTQSNQVAFVYGESLGIQPTWASLDVQSGEIYIGNESNHGRLLKLDFINPQIYERVYNNDQILLVLVKDNDITKHKSTGRGWFSNRSGIGA